LGRVSVLIPTFNRKDVLKKAIEAYLGQSALKEVAEILIIDDGSTDGTDALVAEAARSSPVPIRYYRQANRGQAAARNVGIREARSELVLFTDDDIIPAPDLVDQHLRSHERHAEPHFAVLGYVTWATEVRATPFMRWLGLDGPLFAYAHFAGRTDLDFRAFYTCNLSLKTDFLRKNGMFDEDFKGYGWEDTELGYRLERKGLRLLYNPAALAYHYKFVSFAEACRRAQEVAFALPVFEKKEAAAYLKELDSRTSVKRGFRRRLRSVIVPVLSPIKFLVDSRVPLPWAFYRVLYSEATSMSRKVQEQVSDGRPNP